MKKLLIGLTLLTSTCLYAGENSEVRFLYKAESVANFSKEEVLNKMEFKITKRVPFSKKFEIVDSYFISGSLMVRTPNFREYDVASVEPLDMKYGNDNTQFYPIFISNNNCKMRIIYATKQIEEGRVQVNFRVDLGKKVVTDSNELENCFNKYLQEKDGLEVKLGYNLKQKL